MSLLTTFFAVFLFLLLIFAHEFGHYSAAKLCNVKVNEFSVGMGPQVGHWTKGETEYSVRLFPIGGFCALEGEDGDSNDERSFTKTSSLKKIFILIAGAFNNIVLAFLILVVLFTWVGSPSTKIDSVIEGGPAEAAGISSEDKILSVDGVSVETWTDIINAISNADDDVELSIERDKQQFVYIIPTYVNEAGRVAIGISSKIKHSLSFGIKNAWLSTLDFTNEMVLFFARLFKWQVKSDEVMGIVGIVDVVTESASYGLANVIYLMCIISLNLGFINLLPLPALDGGRILFVIIRWIFKGKISDKAEGIIHTIGMVLLMILMVYLVINDTIRLLH